MKRNENNNLLERIDKEGFDYAFCDYSDFEEIDDPKFHRLRKAYVKAAIALRDYIGFGQ